MNYKNFLSGIAAGTLAAGAALIAVVLGLDPEKGTLSLIAFFGSIFIFLTGVFTLLGFFIRRMIKGMEILYGNVRIAFRQGILLSFFITVVLVLNSFDILVLTDAILLFFSIMLLEFYFRGKKNGDLQL